MSTFKKNIVLSSQLLFLVLFVGYYSSITMFYHTHWVEGQVISHSHFYKNTGNTLPSHSHTKSGYIYIVQISTAQWKYDLYQPCLPLPVCLVIHAPSINDLPELIIRSIPFALLRAPPAA